MAPDRGPQRFTVMIHRVYSHIRSVSMAIANGAAHPWAQLLVVVLCGVWWLLGGSEERLAATMSIGAFILTQMVLNMQKHREIALQLKIDELLLAMGEARNEVVGIEHKTEEEIQDLRESRDA